MTYRFTIKTKGKEIEVGTQRIDEKEALWFGDQLIGVLDAGDEVRVDRKYAKGWVRWLTLGKRARSCF